MGRKKGRIRWLCLLFSFLFAFQSGVAVSVETNSDAGLSCVIFLDGKTHALKDNKLQKIGKRSQSRDYGDDADTYYVKPYIENGEVWLPLRYTAEALGMKVTWNAQDNSTVISGKGRNISLSVSNQTATAIDGTVLPLEMRNVADSIIAPLNLIEQLLEVSVRVHDNGLIVLAGNDSIDLTRAYERLDRPALMFPAEATEEQLQEADALIEQFPLEKWLECVPENHPGKAGGDSNTSGSLTWDPQKPDGLTDPTSCKFYTLEDPPAPIKYFDVPVMSGKVIKVPYYEANNKIVLFQARIDYEKLVFTRSKIDLLSSAYLTTGDEKYAYYVAAAFDKWADAMPDYYITDQGSVNILTPDEAADKNYLMIQRASFGPGAVEELNTAEVYAYNRIQSSKALKQLSEAKGYDVTAHIEKDLFRNVCDFLVTMSAQTHAENNLTNMMQNMMRTASMLHEPKYVEFANEYFELMRYMGFGRDGMWPESFEYHDALVYYMTIMPQILLKYYELYPEEEGELSEEIRGVGGFFEQGRKNVKAVGYPGGGFPAIGDTIPNGSRAPAHDETNSQVLPAYGFLTLGDGVGENQVQMNMSFVDSVNHGHLDTTGITLWGVGHELLGDNGYVKTDRYQAIYNFAHNMVSIDEEIGQSGGAWQANGNAGHLTMQGNLTMYETGKDGIQVCEVDGGTFYENASRLQRMNILNTVDPEHPYLIDLYRVTGGKRHTYLLGGSTRQDEKYKYKPLVRSSFPLEKFEKGDEDLLCGITSAYIIPFYNTFEGGKGITSDANGNWWVKMMDDKKSFGLKVLMVDDGNSELFLGTTVAPTMSEGFAAANTRSTLLVRRELPGVASEDEQLDSFFVGVMEVMDSKDGEQAESVVEKIERVPLAEKNPEHICLKVYMKGGRVDTYLVSMNTPEITGKEPGTVKTADGEFEMQGRIGINISGAGDLDCTKLIGANYIKTNGETLTADKAFYEGELIGAEREDGMYLVSNTELPEGDALKGKFLSMEYPPIKIVPNEMGEYPRGIEMQEGVIEVYEIDHVENRDGKTYIYTAGDHGLEIDRRSVQECYRPQRTAYGTATYKIWTRANR